MFCLHKCNVKPRLLVDNNTVSLRDRLKLDGSPAGKVIRRDRRKYPGTPSRGSV